MVITETHVYVVAGLAFVTVGALLLTAPTLQAGANRLKLLMNTLGVAVVVICGIGGVVLLGWGFAAKDKELIYISFIPLVAAGATWNFITRRHRTWWGLLGANDSRERSQSFWRETSSLWRGRDPDAGPAAPRSRIRRETTPGDEHTVSFSFNLGGRGRGLGSLLRFGAHRLSTDRVAVFPTMLQMAIVLDGIAKADHVAAFRQDLTIRRDDGGPLDLHARSDLHFLTLALGPADADGTYVLTVGLHAGELPAGPFSGAIEIETGEADQPLLTVPVFGEITTSDGA